jgi:hypothetical protein
MWHIQTHSPLTFQGVKNPQVNGVSFGSELTRWFKNRPEMFYELACRWVQPEITYLKRSWRGSFNVNALIVISSPHTQQFYCHKRRDSVVYIRGVSKKFGEWYQKTNKTEDTNRWTFIGLQNNRRPSQHTVGNVHKASGTVSKGLFRNWLQNRCHMFLSCRHVAKRAPLMMLFKRGNRKKSTHRTPLIWRLRAHVLQT